MNDSLDLPPAGKSIGQKVAAGHVGIINSILFACGKLLKKGRMRDGGGHAYMYVPGLCGMIWSKNDTPADPSM